MRPEGADRGGYGEIGDDASATDFVPWRPGDPPVTDERGDQAAVDDAGRSEHQRPGGAAGGWWRTPPPAAGDQAERRSPARPSRWWTEDQPAVFHPGDRVRSQQPTGGLFGTAVPAGAVGHVESVRQTLFGDGRATVRFDNGYTAEVDTTAIERKGWF